MFSFSLRFKFNELYVKAELEHMNAFKNYLCYFRCKRAYICAQYSRSLKRSIHNQTKLKPGPTEINHRG